MHVHICIDDMCEWTQIYNIEKMANYNVITIEW